MEESSTLQILWLDLEFKIGRQILNQQIKVIKQRHHLRSCSDPEIERDSDVVECNDDEADLDGECLSEDCFLHYDKQDSKSIC